MRFDDAFALVLAWEGGFSDHPDDPGGPTNLGITQRAFSRFYCKPASIDRLRSLKPADVRPIYEEHYWKECRCPELPDGLDLLFVGAFTQSAQLAYAISAYYRSRGTVTVTSTGSCLAQPKLKPRLSRGRMTSLPPRTSTSVCSIDFSGPRAATETWSPVRTSTS